MSSSSKGTRREYDVIDAFIPFGFWYCKANRSGQCIADHRKDARIPGDLLLWSRIHGGFQTEVGGIGKRLRVEFEELRARLLPGFRPLIVRFVDGRRWYYLSEDDRFANVGALLNALQEVA